MKLNNLKYGFLISATTFLSSGTLSLYAQNEAGQAVKIEESETYKKKFLETVSPENHEINIEFMVDSVPERTSNGEFFSDINVIGLLAYLDQDSDEYQSYMASKHIVAHELWHRIAMLNAVLEKPLSATEYRTVQDNFEISASIAQLLSFREDYINEPEEKRQILRELEDPKIRMYVMAAENGIINPFSNDKKDFDFEMEFIAKTVSSFWQNNLSPLYAPKHNEMTEKSGRKEFASPVYEKNFWRDIKVMNTIGGIDFSKYYDVKEVRNLREFKKGDKEDSILLKRPLFEPDFEAWINKKSKLKRFSRQQVAIPNFTAPLLKKEREQRQDSLASLPYKFRRPSGSKTYPMLKAIFYTAAELENQSGVIIKIYPNGSIDKIGKENADGIAPVITLNYDKSFEKGTLFKGRKHGEFIYYNADKKEIGRCTFKNGRALNGTMVYAADNIYIRYIYQNAKLQNIETVDKNGKPVALLKAPAPRNTAGMAPQMDRFGSLSFGVYEAGLLLADVDLTDKNTIKEWRETNGKTISVKRFYDTGAKFYELRQTLTPQENAAAAPLPSAKRPAAPNPLPSSKQAVKRETLFAPNGTVAITAEHSTEKTAVKVKGSRRGLQQVLNALCLPPDITNSLKQLFSKYIPQKENPANLAAAKSTPLHPNAGQTSPQP